MSSRMTRMAVTAALLVVRLDYHHDILMKQVIEHTIKEKLG